MDRNRNLAAGKMIAVTMLAILVSGCERFPQSVYNCNPFPVTIESHPEWPPIEARSGFWTRNPDDHYERMRYLYPDRSARSPRVLQASQVKTIRNRQGGPRRSEEQKTADMCAAVGPGVLVVINS